MIRVIFKNLEESALAREAALDRLSDVVEKFPDLEDSDIRVTLERENSRTQPGPDLFKAKVYCQTGRYRGLTLEKAAPNLYVALADLVDHMLERLNRFGDRQRVIRRKQARRATGAA